MQDPQKLQEENERLKTELEKVTSVQKQKNSFLKKSILNITAPQTWKGVTVGIALSILVYEIATMDAAMFAVKSILAVGVILAIGFFGGQWAVKKTQIQAQEALNNTISTSNNTAANLISKLLQITTGKKIIAEHSKELSVAINQYKPLLLSGGNWVMAFLFRLMAFSSLMGVLAIAVSFAIAIATFMQVELLEKQNKKLDKQNILLEQQDSLLVQQNELFDQQNIKVETQTTLMKRQTEQIDTQNILFGQQNTKVEEQTALLSSQNDFVELQTIQMKYQTELLRKQNTNVDEQTKLMTAQNELLGIQNKSFEEQLKQINLQIIQATAQNGLLKDQNLKIDRQNNRIDQQTSLQEAERRSSLIFLFSSLVDAMEKELYNSSNKKLSPHLMGQIIALSTRFKPYRYLENDSLISNPLSPERGQLLVSLIESKLHNVTYFSLFSKATFKFAELSNVNLRGAYLSRIDLEGANLSGADLGETDMRGVNLENANMSNANLVGINWLSDTTSKVNLKNVNLEGAKVKDKDFFSKLKTKSINKKNPNHPLIIGLNDLQKIYYVDPMLHTHKVHKVNYLSKIKDRNNKIIYPSKITETYYVIKRK